VSECSLGLWHLNDTIMAFHMSRFPDIASKPAPFRTALGHSRWARNIGAAMLTAAKQAAMPRRMASPVNPTNTGVDVAWKARMMAANAAKKKTPNALPRCFSFRSLFMRAVLIEAPPGLHRAMARRIAANVAKLPELLRKRSE
jgi:hypothetical protein